MSNTEARVTQSSRRPADVHHFLTDFALQSACVTTKVMRIVRPSVGGNPNLPRTLRCNTLRKRWLPLLLAALVIGGPIAWYKWPSTASAAEASLVAPVKQGDFKVLVTTTGELRASKFVQVTGPAQAQAVNVYQTRSRRSFPKARSSRKATSSPSWTGAASRRVSPTSRSTCRRRRRSSRPRSSTPTLNLAQSREDVRTAEYTLEEKKLAKEQAKYEAPTIKRQAEIDYEKAQRALDQSKRNLDTKTKQAVAKMSSVGADLGRQQNQLKNIQDVMGSFTIKAPGAGHGDLRPRVERQEEGRRLAVERVGPDRRDAAGSRADGVADLHQ